MPTGLTGYLLDNRAYWGTVVATQIASKAPLIGPYLQRLMGGQSGVGVVPGSPMPAVQLADSQLNSMAAFAIWSTEPAASWAHP
jgi:hypothetical protein